MAARKLLNLISVIGHYVARRLESLFGATHFKPQRPIFSRRIMAVLIYGVFALLSVQSGVAQVVIPYTVSNSLILVPVEVNGHQLTLLFDTGSVNTLVDAQAAGIDVKLSAMQHVSYSRGAEGQIVEMDASLKVGGQKHIATVFVGNFKGISEQLHVKVDGILGQDFLGQYSSIRIDRKQHVITLDR